MVRILGSNMRFFPPSPFRTVSVRLSIIPAVPYNVKGRELPRELATSGLLSFCTWALNDIARFKR
jgi:hypothetical protein